MPGILGPILKRLVRHGRLTVRWPNGQLTAYTGSQPGPSAGLHFVKQSAVRRLTLNPALAMGECYMDGSLAPLDCTIYDVLDVLMLNRAAHDGSPPHPFMRLRTLLDIASRRIDQFNPAERSRRNVAHHYDLNGRLYRLFLDRDQQYSCAYFPRGDETLEEAQIAKKRHIAAKLKLDRPDLEVLDIGSGWGGMALTLAREYGARVTGITLSTEQLQVSRARAEAEGLADRVSFELLDYRALTRDYDRVVSVGMFEHVGVTQYRVFFDTLRRALRPDGVALLHSIGRNDGPCSTNPWMAKYIFPGGYAPSLSEVVPFVERARLWITDLEILRLHYAETLRHWRRRFAANRDAIAAIYDERFCRMFEFYLAAAELAFRHEGQLVFQMQITRDQTAVPLTRDYITDFERQQSRIRADA